MTSINSNNSLSIQVPREAYKPFSHPKYFEYFKSALSTVWRVETVDMNSDILNYQTGPKDEQEIIQGILRGFTILETRIGDYWADIVTKIFPKHEIIAACRAFAFFECFDKETELLTDQGWVNVQNLSRKNKFAQYNLETKEISFSQPTKLVKYHYKGIMHLYQSKNTDMCVTPNHDMIAYLPNKNKIDKVKSFQRKLGRNYQYPNSGFVVNPDAELSLYEKLLIAIQADGHLFGLKNKQRIGYVQINLTKKRKIKLFKSYLENLDIEYTLSVSKNICGNTKSLFSFTLLNFNPDLIKNFDFFDLNNMSVLKAKSIIEEVIKWDGNNTASGCYYNTNEQAVDKIQAIASLCGIRAQKGINRTASQSLKVLLPSGKLPQTTKTCYVLSFKNQTVAKNYTTYPHKIEIDYDDYVYCVTVPTNNIISRRNGKVAITGNCIHGQAYSHLSDCLGLNDYDAFLDDPITKSKIDYFVKHPNDLVSLAVFSGAGEGVALFSSFSVLLSLSRNGRYKGLAQIISWSIIDEMTHSNMGCELFKDLVQEKGITQEEKDLIYQGFDVVLNNEFNFINQIFNNRELSFINKNDLIQYMYLRANDRLTALGLDPVYTFTDKAYIISDWFVNEVVGQSSHDFFAQAINGDNYTSLLKQDFNNFNYSNVDLEWSDKTFTI